MYSGVTSLGGIRLMIFLAEYNQMEAWGTDISSAYLNAFTKEKLFVKAGPEFGDQEGHILLVEKALYGLRTSGVRWHERLADCLRGMGFFPCKAKPNICEKNTTVPSRCEAFLSSQQQDSRGCRRKYSPYYNPCLVRVR